MRKLSMRSDSLFSLQGINDQQVTEEEINFDQSLIKLSNQDSVDICSSQKQSSEGCKRKRETKSKNKLTSVETSRFNDIEDMSDFTKFHGKTLRKIEEIKMKIKNTYDKKEIKRLKNMISAYVSRLHKRETVQQLKEQVFLRDQQMAAILKVLQEEIPVNMMTNVLKRIRRETPANSSTQL